MSEHKLRDERRQHQKLRVAVRRFLSDFQTGTHDDWQESLAALAMIVARRTTNTEGGKNG